MKLVIAALLLALLDVLLLGGFCWVQGSTAATQLSAHFQQTLESSLTALGLILQKNLVGGDVVMAETIVNAMFDGSVLQAVELKDIDGEVVFSRSFAEPMASYPSWLSLWIETPAMSRSMEMTDGWNILGDLSVSSHPHHLYNTLWRSVTEVLPQLVLLTLVTWGLQLLALVWWLRGARG